MAICSLLHSCLLAQGQRIVGAQSMLAGWTEERMGKAQKSLGKKDLLCVQS